MFQTDMNREREREEAITALMKLSRAENGL